MSLSGSFARIVALIGAAAILWRRLPPIQTRQLVGRPLNMAFKSTP